MLSVFDAQTEIMKWLERLGHRVNYHPLRLDQPEQGAYRRRSCESKRRFTTYLEAHSLEPTMLVYGCRFCGGYHLTTPRKR